MKRHSTQDACSYSPVKRLSILENTPKQRKEQVQSILDKSKDKLLNFMQKGKGDLRRYVLLKNVYKDMKKELVECSYNACARYKDYWSRCVSGLYGTDCGFDSWAGETTTDSVVSIDIDMFDANGMETACPPHIDNSLGSFASGSYLSADVYSSKSAFPSSAMQGYSSYSYTPTTHEPPSILGYSSSTCQFGSMSTGPYYTMNTGDKTVNKFYSGSGWNAGYSYTTTSPMPTQPSPMPTSVSPLPASVELFNREEEYMSDDSDSDSSDDDDQNASNDSSRSATGCCALPKYPQGDSCNHNQDISSSSCCSMDKAYEGHNHSSTANQSSANKVMNFDMNDLSGQLFSGFYSNSLVACS